MIGVKLFKSAAMCTCMLFAGFNGLSTPTNDIQYNPSTDPINQRADYLDDLWFDVYGELELIKAGGAHDGYLIKHQIMLDEYDYAIAYYQELVDDGLKPIESISSRYDDNDYTIYHQEASAILYILKADPKLKNVSSLDDCKYHLINMFDILEKYNL